MHAFSARPRRGKTPAVKNQQAATAFQSYSGSVLAFFSFVMSQTQRVAAALNAWSRVGLGGVDEAGYQQLVADYFTSSGSEAQPTDCKLSTHHEYSSD